MKASASSKAPSNVLRSAGKAPTPRAARAYPRAQSSAGTSNRSGNCTGVLAFRHRSASRWTTSPGFSCFSRHQTCRSSRGRSTSSTVDSSWARPSDRDRMSSPDTTGWNDSVRDASLSHLPDYIRRAIEITPAAGTSERIIDITTLGRRTGRLRRIEIFFYRAAGITYLCSGAGGATTDWHANLHPHGDGRRPRPPVTAQARASWSSDSE